MIITDDVVTRFWEKVDKRGPDDCWEWQAGTRTGYGVIKISGRQFQAHRLSWVMAYGEIPNTLFICHHCDNRACVNPRHFFLGTHADNIRDAYYKGRIKVPKSLGRRFGKGEEHPNSKLTESDVKEIRQLYQGGGVTYRNLSEYYGVDHTLIYQVVRRKRWTHI